MLEGRLSRYYDVSRCQRLFSIPHQGPQNMNMLSLAPDIQEVIFFLPPVTEGRPAVTKRHLRQGMGVRILS